MTRDTSRADEIENRFLRFTDHDALTPIDRSQFDRSQLDRAQLRASMRKRRNAVPTAERRLASIEVARHLLSRSLLSSGQRVAIYAPFDGEIDLLPLLRHARRMKLRLYLPRIVNMRARKMEFVELSIARGCSTANSRLHWLLGPRENLHRRIDPRELDVVLIPVVAFDAHGWRLGFGGGFYDRKLAFMRRSFVRKPALIGVGYEFQRVPPQPSCSWDVPLHCVVTERSVHHIQPRTPTSHQVANP